MYRFRMASTPSLKSFLLECDNFSKNALDTFFVMGNESADMDSIIGSLVYSFYKAQLMKNCKVVPVIAIDRKYFGLRKDVALWLNEAGITDLDKLVFLNNVWDIFAKPEKSNFKIALIDHNKPLKENLSGHVVEVIDHHERMCQYSPGQLVVERMELVGSCCTLLGDMLLSDAQIPDRNTLLKLVHGVILLDTENFSEEIGKTTPLDVRVVEGIEKVLQLNESGRCQVFQRLMAAKSDVSGLSLELMVNKDLKVFQTRRSSDGRAWTIAIPGVIGVDVYELAAQTERLRRIRKDLDADSMIIMSTPDQRVRHFLLTSTEERANRDLLQFLSHEQQKLNLQKIETHSAGEVVVFSQDNLLTSRKKFVPVLMRFFDL